VQKEAACNDIFRPPHLLLDDYLRNKSVLARQSTSIGEDAASIARIPFAETAGIS
jgi:hypothetical protein